MHTCRGHIQIKDLVESDLHDVLIIIDERSLK